MMKRTLVMALVASVCATLAAVGLSQAAPHKTNRLPTGQDAAARFAVLRSARTASATEVTLPETTASGMTAAGALDAELELEPAGAVYVRFPQAQPGWIVPGKRGMCLVVESSIEITKDCALSASAEQRGIVMISRGPKSTTAYGLVPDGATVSATGESGEVSSVPVEGNVFAYRSAGLRAVSVHGLGAGVSTTPVG